MKKSLLYIFVFIAVQFFGSWLVYAVWMAAQGHSGDYILKALNDASVLLSSPAMLIAGSAFSSAVLLALFAWRGWCPMSKAYLRTRPWPVFFWCGVAAVGSLLPSLWLNSLLGGLNDASGVATMQMLSSRWGYLPLCLLAPLAEEVVFRGAILGALRQQISNKWLAVGVSAVVFAVAHLNLVQMPHAFVAGLFLGWLYVRTGSILPGVAFHWVNNTAVYVACHLMPGLTQMDRYADLFGGNQRAVVLSLVFSLLILVPALYQLFKK